MASMKQIFRFQALALRDPGHAFLVVLMLLLIAVPHGLGHGDDQSPDPSFLASTGWRGSTSVDSAQGSSLHLRLFHEEVTLAMSMVHDTVGTAGFTGFGSEALDELSIGMNADSPYLVAGDLGLAGLSRFLFRPDGVGPLLPASGRKPLQVERPDVSRYRGVVLGKDAGLLAVHPLSDPARFVSGAWFSPSGSPISVIILAGSEPGRSYDGWYEPDSIRADRIWGAASLGMARKWILGRMSLSGALAGSVGLPGPDGMAARMEAMLAIRRIRFDAEVSVARGYWRSPAGATAVPVGFDLAALYRFRGLELSGAYRQEHKSLADEEPWRSIRGYLLVGSGSRGFKLAGTLGQASGQELPDFTLDTRWWPGLFPAFLPGLALVSTWKTKDGLSERFDLGASLKGGGTLSWSLDAGLRHDSLGRYMRGAASVMAHFGNTSLRFELESDGWLALAGGFPDAPMVLSLVWSFRSP